MNELLRRDWAGVVAYVGRYTANGDEAKDIAQDTFLSLWYGRVSWKGTGSLRSFLYGVARNLARNRGRSWHQTRVISLESIQPETARPTTSTAPHPDEVVEEGELLDRLERAVAGLPPRRQEVFTLIRLHGLSYEEAASVLGIATQTVANHLSAALRDLRRRLGPLYE